MKLRAVKKITLWGIRFVVGLTLLSYLVSMIDLSSILAAYQSANKYHIAVAVILVIPNIGLQWLKWRFLLRKGTTVVRTYDVTASLFCGFALGMMTPVRLGEFGGRALMFPSASKMKVAGLTLADKAATMAVTVTFGGVALWLFAVHNDWFYGSAKAVVLLVVCVLAVPMIIILKRDAVWQWARRNGRRVGRVDELMKKIEIGMTRFSKGDLLYVFLLSSLFYLTFVTQFSVFLNAFADAEFWWSTIAIMTIMLAKTMAPTLTLGELGVREGLSVFLLGFVGVSQAAAFNASCLLFFTNILFPSLIGSVFLFRMPVPVHAVT